MILRVQIKWAIDEHLQLLTFMKITFSENISKIFQTFVGSVNDFEICIKKRKKKDLSVVNEELI